VAPLAVPPQPTAALAPEELPLLEQSDAVRLFLQRAQAAQPGFALNAGTAASIATICRRLDGLPLAIELAAARLGVLPVEEILARLDDRFRLLRRGPHAPTGRHQTLLAAMDWSYGLLDAAAQVVLRRLAVFAGGWEVAAAEAVCADDQEQAGGSPHVTAHEQADAVEAVAVLELLDELQDRSLVYVYMADETPRYGMLETVRQYGLQQLERMGETAVVQDRHLHWCVALAEQAAPSLQGAQQEVWLERLEREHDDLRAALRWSLRAGTAGSAALRLAGSLARFWLMHTHFSEGRRWLGEMLAAEGGTATERARALDGAGLLAEGQGAYEEATRLLEESLALWRTIDDRPGVARALANQGLVAERQGQYARARGLLEEALAIFRALDARDDIAGTLMALGLVVEFQGDYRTAWSVLEESLSLFRALGDGWGVANTLGNLAVTATRHGEYARALVLYEEALMQARAVGDRRGIARWLNGLALSLASQGEYERAQAFLEESLAVSRAQGDLRSTAASFNDLGEIAREQGAYVRALGLQLQLGDGWGIANSYRNLASVATEAGDEERTPDLLLRSLALFQALGDRWGIAQCLELGGRLTAGRERWAEAAQLLAGADALRRSIDTQLDPNELGVHERLLQTVRTALGEERLSTLTIIGNALELGDLVAWLASALQPGATSRTVDGIPSR
jgi:predicted ATPase/Tfp pilus assembly protein PilF